MNGGGSTTFPRRTSSVVLWKVLGNEIYEHCGMIAVTLVSENGKRMTLWFKTADANRLRQGLLAAIIKQKAAGEEE